MQTSTDGSPLGFGLSWLINKDDFGDYYYHVGDGAGSEAVMVFYPDLDLGVVVMANVRGYSRDIIVKGLVSAWMNEK
jgi:CubicO group peptidase (beta-lactamase class C family)